MAQNPIQEVLAAEREAQRQVDEMKRESENALDLARRRARSIRDRNDERTKRALARFEQQQQQSRDHAAETLRQESKMELKEYESAITDNLEKLVEHTFQDFWPV